MTRAARRRRWREAAAGVTNKTLPLSALLSILMSLLLTACGTISCQGCGPPAQLAIIGVYPDPAEVLRVCVDGDASCLVVRIEPADPSRNPGRGPQYGCTTSDPQTISCRVSDDTASLDFDHRSAKELSGRRVVVTVSGGMPVNGQAADEQAAGAFKYWPADGPCGCDYSGAQVRLPI